jgi:cytochrome c-type biogenesis protein CcmE
VQVEEFAPTKSPRAKWIAGISLIVVAIGVLAAWAITSPGALAYYKTPTEIKALRIHPGDQRTYRVGGRVKALKRNGSVVTFLLTDGHSNVAVSYRGDVPDTLKEGTDAIAEGRTFTSDGTLLAERVQAKCSSKFVPKDRPQDVGKA